MRIALLVTWLGSAFLMAQDKPTIKKVPVTRTSPVSGKEMFNSYCAPCHGTDAKGTGPAAAALKKAPRDLTMLAHNNDGKFPGTKVLTTLLEVDQPVHGSKDMPMWGPLLSSVSRDQAEVQLRIANIVKYVESMQVK